MSLLAAKTYLRDRMAALDYVEWDDIAWNTLPITRMDSAFHLVQGQCVVSKNDPTSIHFEVPVELRIFKAPTRNPLTAHDALLDDIDTVLADILSAPNRLTQSGIKNLVCQSVLLAPLNGSNDNGIVATISLAALVVLSTE